jgi:hypothetical protein
MFFQKIEVLSSVRRLMYSISDKWVIVFVQLSANEQNLETCH